MERRSFLGALGALVAGVVARREPPVLVTDLSTLESRWAVPPIPSETAELTDGSVWISHTFRENEMAVHRLSVALREFHG